MHTLILQVEYDGTDFSGWQMQKNSRTVQAELQRALKKIFDFDKNIVGAGRTDAGVHSSGQVVHCVLNSMPTIPSENLVKAVNSYLPMDIRAKKAGITENQFNARFDALAREYKYNLHLNQSVFLRRFSTFYKHPINVDDLFASAALFLGKHDFTTFSKLNESTLNYECDVKECFWHQINDSQYQLTIKANRFVYGMVRAIVGAMLDVARGKRQKECILQALMLKDRLLSSKAAPAEGLNLFKIYYPKEYDELIY